MGSLARSLLTCGSPYLKRAICFDHGKYQVLKRSTPLLGQLNGCSPYKTQQHSYCTEADQTEEEVKEEKPTQPTVDVETSIRYLKSNAYALTYGGAKVWQPYRRNHRGHLPPSKIRRSCYVSGKLRSGNPCPICRDDHLLLHPKNADLLNQFISPLTGEIISNHVTNLCMRQHKNLNIAMQQAWDQGYVKKNMPFKEYDYKDYYPQLKKKADNESS